MIPERVGEDQDHGNDKTVNGGGFNHGQADKQGAGDGPRLVGLLGDGLQRLGDSTGLTEGRANGADGDVRPVVIIETMPSNVKLSIV